MSLDDNPIPIEQPETSGAAQAPPPVSAPDLALAQDLRVPWTWLDLLLLGVVAVAGSILLRLVVGKVFVTLGVTPAQYRASPALSGLYSVAVQISLTAMLLGYLFAQFRVNFGMPFWRTIGWHSLEPGKLPRGLRYLGFVLGGFLLALLVQVVSLEFRTRAKLPIHQLFRDRRITLAFLLMAVLIAPWFEETIFRGYIYPVVARSYGTTVGVLGTGIFFGLMHATQLWGGWVQIASIVVLGIILTYVRAVTRTVLASFLVHVSYNFFISFGTALILHGLRLLVPRH